jgi:two-component system LytT family response regulator
VDWFEADGNYVRLHVGATEHRLRSAIARLAQQLDPRQFAQIHRSMIVNLDRVREVQPWFGGDYVAILKDGQRLRVSRTYAPQVLRPMQ